MKRNYLRTIPKAWRSMAQVFVALGDEHRQRILLTFQKGERLTVGQIAEVATLSRPAVSHHLKILRNAGVLLAERTGREVYLRVNRAMLEETLAAVLEFVRTET